jgi:hypothetical protein
VRHHHAPHHFAPLARAFLAIALVGSAAACDGGDTRELDGAGGAGDASATDGGPNFRCSLDCARCPPSVADRCEDAARFCTERTDPNCCLQAELQFDCSEPPPPDPECAFDCSTCFDEVDRDACTIFEDQCIAGPAADRDACCDAVAETYAGCDVMEEPNTCYDCTQCETAQQEQACELGVEGCEQLPPAERDTCCANIAVLFPSCDPTGGACGVDCGACPADVQMPCDREQRACEGLPPFQALTCCNEVRNTFGAECGGASGNTCDAPCEECPSPAGQAACEQAERTCELIPDADQAAACCEQIEANLDLVCGGL